MGASNETMTVVSIYAEHLLPNPWNPNVMDFAMFEKEVASIEAFGFVDPLTVRQLGDRYQIIDGEHRWRAGKRLGMVLFPCIVIDVDDETAKELTIVLNETRGKADEKKLSELVRELSQKRDEDRLARVLPFTPDRLRAMITNTEQIDWSKLHEKREQLKKDREQWVEKIYRMPVTAATVLDEAVERVKDQEGLEQDWQALEMIAADSLASG
jgi:hypothetical protein